MGKPDIIIIGAMKAATSSVSSFLEEHPAVHMPLNTEPCFFSDDENWAKGPDWYERHFDAATDGQLIAEGSNDYTFASLFPDTVERMTAFCPKAKLIYMVRHPIERIISAWIQNRADKGDDVPHSLDLAIQQQPERFVDPSLYGKQLAQYRAHFNDRQIFIGFMEEMSNDPSTFFSALSDFLEIDLPQTPATASGIHKNPSAGKAVPTQAYSTIRSIPGARALSRLFPASLKQAAKGILSKKLDARPRFSPEVYSMLISQIKPDAEQFLAHTGRPQDRWDWAQR